ncbi:MAG: hypothetical protein GC184_04930 [Rhizobiales bacterium]|nr:hypothetical protein [Hyphomicrobiales bacterium]
MKKLWLHIGTHKTGSTSLQNFFFRNRQKLAKAGVYYPAEGSYFYRGELSQSLLSHSLRNAKPDYLPANLKIDRAACEGNMRRDIEKSDCPAVLVSSEHFSHSATLAQVESIKKCFAPVVSDMQVIVYLRRQDHLIESAYNQLTTAGINTLPFRTWLDQSLKGGIKNFSYDDRLHLFAEVFGKSNLHVRVFEKSQLHPSGLIHDFMKLMGIEDLSEFELVPSLNRSMPPEFIETLRCASAAHPDVQLRKILCKLMRASPIRGLDPSDYTLFDAALRKQVLDTCRGSNERIARDFLNREDGVLFHETETPDIPTYPGISVERMGEIFSKILLQQQMAKEKILRERHLPVA